MRVRRVGRVIRERCRACVRSKKLYASRPIVAATRERPDECGLALTPDDHRPRSRATLGGSLFVRREDRDATGSCCGSAPQSVLWNPSVGGIEASPPPVAGNRHVYFVLDRDRLRPSARDGQYRRGPYWTVWSSYVRTLPAESTIPSCSGPVGAEAAWRGSSGRRPD